MFPKLSPQQQRRLTSAVNRLDWFHTKLDIDHGQNLTSFLCDLWSIPESKTLGTFKLCFEFLCKIHVTLQSVVKLISSTVAYQQFYELIPGLITLKWLGSGRKQMSL